MTEQNETTTEAPKISKITTTWETEDEIRTNRHGDEFAELQDSDIEFEVDDFDRDDTLDRVRIWFDNGASMAYWHKDEMTVEERVYSSDDPSSVWDSVEIGLSHGGREDFVECVEQSLDVYVRDMGDLDDLEDGWTHLYEVLSHD
jgi:hypothetical protein